MLNCDRIRELRDAAGWTQEDAAKTAGFSNAQQWHLIESGRRANITLETLGKIAAALKVAPAELLKPAKRKRGK